MRKLLLIRPEPGLTASAARAQAMGLDVIRCPLFEVEPVPWDVPDPGSFDALLLTSANAIRHGGPGLESLRGLPVHAVGEATADAAREAGLDVRSTGSGSVLDLLEKLPSQLRMLNLAGEDHRDVEDARIEQRIVYRSRENADPQLPPLKGLVVAIHSARAGRRLSQLAHDRPNSAIAAISLSVADACGSGWEIVEAAAEPNDKCLLALAAMLCHTSPPE